MQWVEFVVLLQNIKKVRKICDTHIEHFVADKESTFCIDFDNAGTGEKSEVQRDQLFLFLEGHV